jgi:hypothetical protein
MTFARRILPVTILSLVWCLTACSNTTVQTATSTPVTLPSETATMVPSATFTTAPTLTATTIPSATPTATRATTPTTVPSLTAVPSPAAASASGLASLTGMVSLADKSSKPFPTTVELYQGDNTLVAKVKTVAQGKYSFKALKPGTYTLWVLISSKTMVTGCSDVQLPASDWALGLVFAEGQSMTMKGSSLKLGIMLAQNLPSTLQPSGYYAVSPAFEYAGGAEKVLDVTLTCE